MNAETRSAAAEVLDVNTTGRVITVIAAPYHESATVPFRNDVWSETIEPTAFADADATKVRVCREHNRSDAVGRVLRFDTRDPRGLIADIKIARTIRGDDTLALAAEEMLSASIAFAVRQGGEILDHANKIRRITRAWLDHIGLVLSPAYAGASVVGVRSATPLLDAVLRDPFTALVALRCDEIRWRQRQERRR